MKTQNKAIQYKVFLIPKKTKKINKKIIYVLKRSLQQTFWTLIQITRTSLYTN